MKETSIKLGSVENEVGNYSNCSPLHSNLKALKSKAFRTLRKQNGAQNGVNNFSIFAPLMKLNPPKLYPLKGKLSDEWFVQYEVWDPELKKVFKRKVRTGINDIDNIKEKKIYGAALLRLVEKYFGIGQEELVDDIPILEIPTFSSAMKDRLLFYKATNKQRTYTTFRSICLRFEKFLNNKKIKIDAIGPKHVTDYIVYLKQPDKKDKIISNRTVNNNLTQLSSLFQSWVEMEFISKNPFKKVKKLQKVQSRVNEPFTNEEITRITEHLLGSGRPDLIRLFLFWCHEYYLTLRTSEVLSLQKVNYQLESGIVLVYGTEAKNNKSRPVAIPNQFYAVIKELKLDEIGDSDYIFSVGLMPGKKLCRLDEVTTLWRETIKQGLGIDKNMYGIKHTAAIKMDESGTPVRQIQEHLRHSSLQMTEIYLQRWRMLNKGSIAASYPDLITAKEN